MPRRTAKPPRLWKRREQRDEAGRLVRAATWIIVDRHRQFGTGCSADDLEGANQALAAYIGRKYTIATKSGPRPTTEIPVADVLALYARDKMPNQADPKACRRRLKRLAAFFARNVLAEVNGALCRKYAEQQNTDSMARRDLAELRAAINHHRREGLHDRIVSVRMPDARPPRERWLTRSEVAQLLWAAWKYKAKQREKIGSKYPRRHMARFILVALYTGSRASVVAQAALQKEAGRPYMELETGIFIRRPEGIRETKKRRPPIPLPGRLLSHLRRWRRLGFRYVVEWRGRPVVRIDESFRKVVTACSLCGHVTPHTLRHTAATWMMQAGTDPWQASGYLGMSIKTLQTVYGHHDPHYLEGARLGIARHRTVAHPSGNRKQDERRRATG